MTDNKVFVFKSAVVMQSAPVDALLQEVFACMTVFRMQLVCMVDAGGEW